MPATGVLIPRSEVRALGSISDVPAEAWDALTAHEPVAASPFVLHAFLEALERVGRTTAISAGRIAGPRLPSDARGAAREGADAGGGQWVGTRIPEWLRFHILVNDTPLATYLAARRGSGKAAARGTSKRLS